MIKTITNLTTKKWRDIYTNKIAAESLILEYIDKSGKTNKTGCLTQSNELGYWDADSDEWEVFSTPGSKTSRHGSHTLTKSRTGNCSANTCSVSPTNNPMN